MQVRSIQDPVYNKNANDTSTDYSPSATNTPAVSYNQATAALRRGTRRARPPALPARPRKAHETRPRRRLARQDIVPVRPGQLRQRRALAVHRAQLVEAEHEEGRDQFEFEGREPFPQTDSAPCVHA